MQRAANIARRTTCSTKLDCAARVRGCGHSSAVHLFGRMLSTPSGSERPTRPAHGARRKSWCCGGRSSANSPRIWNAEVTAMTTVGTRIRSFFVRGAAVAAVVFAYAVGNIGPQVLGVAGISALGLTTTATPADAHRRFRRRRFFIGFPFFFHRRRRRRCYRRCW
jgi:hypothetical protein